MRIRTAIFAVYVAASSLGFAALMYFILREVRPRHVAAIQRTMDDASRLLAASIAAGWQEDAQRETAHWERIGAAVAAQQTGLRVQVLDPDGRLLADSREPTGGDLPDGFAKRLASRVLDENDGRAAQAEELRSIAPVRLGERVVAQVILLRPVRSLNTWIWSERKKLAAGALAIAALMVVAGWWISAQVSASIERLTAHVEAVRDGARSSPPATRAYEVAKLGRAFEEMRTALEGRQHLERTTQALAHGIKAPLAAVRGAAELLAEDLPPEDRRRFVENLRAESGRIEQIVERLLRLSAVEARRSLQAPEPVAVAALLAEIADGFRSAGAVAGVELAVVSATGVVTGERALLREAIANLVQNALEFTPAGGRVTLRASAVDGHVEIVVEDTGPGVPDYALPRVFERFYSLERPGTGRKSTGLGLALVAEIAHLHGGTAALENRSEGGARATLRLPAA